MKKIYVIAIVIIAVCLLSGIGISTALFLTSGTDSIITENKPVDEEKEQADYEPTDEDKARYAELEQIQNEINEAAASFTDEAGYVEPANYEAAIAAVAAYAQTAMEQGRILSVTSDEQSVATTLNSGINIVYMPKVRGVMAGSGKTEVWTVEPYAWSKEFLVNQAAGRSSRVSSVCDDILEDYSIRSNCRKGEEAVSEEVTVEFVKSFEADSCVFWVSHGGCNKKYGPLVSLGQECNLDNIGIYIEDLIGTRLIVTNDGNFAVTAAFFEYYYEDGDLDNCMFYLAACATLKDDSLAKTFLKKGADLVAGSSQNISILYSIRMAAAVLERMGTVTEGRAMNFQDALNDAKQEYGTQDSIAGLPYSNAEIIFYGDGTYSLTDKERPYDAISGTTPNIKADNVLDTYLKASVAGPVYSYYLLNGKAVLLEYHGSETSLTLPDTIDGHPVAAVGQKCFMQNKTLRDVTIPAGVEAIHPYAFYECENLNTVTLGCGLTVINRFAFTGTPLSTVRVYKGTTAETYASDMGWPNQVTQVEHLELTLAGNILRMGDNIYYVKYNEKSFKKEGLLAWFEPKSKTSNSLILRDANGVETTLFTGKIHGKLAFCGGMIYFEYLEDGQSYLGKCYMDGSNAQRNLGKGKILDSNGSSMFCTGKYDDGFDKISSSDGSRSTMTTKGNFLALLGSAVLYEVSPEDYSLSTHGQLHLMIMSTDGSIVETLYTTNADLYPSSVMQGDTYVAKMVLHNNNDLYFSYGSSGGTGMFFQGGKICKIDLSTGEGEIVAGKKELVAPDFTVNDDGTVNVVDNDYSLMLYDPMMSYKVENGRAYWYNNEDGTAELVLSKSDYSFLGKGKLEYLSDTGINIEYLERSGERIYCLLNYVVKDSEFSLGWRENYKRKTSVMLTKDLTTGEVNTIYTY